MNDSEAYETLRSVANLSQRLFGERFVAGFAMGSLSRGGFSALVSDVDFGLVINDSENEDAATVESLKTTAMARDWALAKRLSVFWSSLQGLRSGRIEGRFPPFDRLDLIDHATLITGVECRSEMLRPSVEELEIDGFEFALDYLANPDRIHEFLNPSIIADADEVYLSKTILFPARFLYTSFTGRVAGNDDAAKFYAEHFEGPDADLIAYTYDWRERNMPPDDKRETLALLEKGLLPLYQRFLLHYHNRFEALGHSMLATRANRWREALGILD